MPAFKILNENHRQKLWSKISESIKGFESLGKKYIISITEQTKSRLQEEKYHAMISDIAATAKISANGLTIDFNHHGKSKANQYAKELLVRWFQIECEQNGEPLKHGGFIYIDPRDGQRCAVRPSTKDFTVKEAANFIEFLYFIGAEYGSQWSERTNSYDQYPELNR